MLDCQIKFKMEAGWTREQLYHEMISPMVQAFSEKIEFQEDQTTGVEGVVTISLKGGQDDT